MQEKEIESNTSLTITTLETLETQEILKDIQSRIDQGIITPAWTQRGGFTRLVPERFPVKTWEIKLLFKGQEAQIIRVPARNRPNAIQKALKKVIKRKRYVLAHEIEAKEFTYNPIKR